MRQIGFLFALILTIPWPANAKASDAASDASQSRYDGVATLSTTTSQASSDDRFTLAAALKPVELASANGRFSLHAALRPDAKAINLVCGSDELFRNGFEN